MNRKLLFPLIICALFLAGCYRQTSESFQQVDSGSAEEIISPTAAQTDADETDATADSSVIEPPADTGAFLTPQSPPAQVEQPTIIIPTSSVPTAIAPTIPVAVSTITRPPDLAVLPTAAATLEELAEGAPCVHTVLAGDTLFRLSLDYGTTVDDLMDLNKLEDDALGIGQLLRIPDCVPELVAEADAEDTGVDDVGGGSAATVAPLTPAITPTPGSQVHIVVAGDTLGSLAVLYDVSVDDIAAFNQIRDLDALAIGQELLIPIEN